MEKIISINLAGRVIAMEDSAYTSLKAYFESLERYFAREEGAEEILNDIESRVAELLSQKLAAGATAITEAHVAEVIAVMGRAEDFAQEDGTTADTSSTYAPPPSGKRAFVRDEKDKQLGGVCSGIAAYLQVDPALVRVIFAVLALGGWGTGILLYLLIWFIVPAGVVPPFSGRRLYRNPEGKWLGGVCTGLATYFDKEERIFRIVFGAPLILSIVTNSVTLDFGSSLFFGSITGALTLIYIVLWIVLPEALTDFQRMEMRGQKVDINSIRENVYSDVRSKAQDFSNEVRQSASRLSERTSEFMSARSRTFAQEARTAGRPLVNRTGQVISTLFRAFFLFVATVIAFALFMALIAYFFGGFSKMVDGFILQTSTHRTLAWIGVLLTLGIPVLSLITTIARRLLKIKAGARYLYGGYSLLWVVGFGCLLALGTSMKREFSRKESVQQEVAVAQPAARRLIVRVPGTPVQYSNSLPWLQGDIDGWDVNDNVMTSARVRVAASLSPDSLYHVILKRQSWGRNADLARQRAESLSYAVQNAPGTDSIIDLASGYAITKDQRYRGQDVVVEVQVPAGAGIRFDPTVDEKLIYFTEHVRRYRGRHRGWEVHVTEENSIGDWDAGVDYIMQPNGKLLDPLHPNGRPDEDDEPYMRHSSYRYQWGSHRRDRESDGAEWSSLADSIQNNL
jgi:phage shock protein PspC (stress-responsive transcriptional regulator)